MSAGAMVLNGGRSGQQVRSPIEWKLQWSNPSSGVYVAEEHATTKGNQLHRVVKTRHFATVRSAFGADGLHNDQNGFVVSRNSFDEVRHFPTFEEAKLYVESLYALERT